MGNLTHTVSGNVASFRSAARVPITSLKCNFLPVQTGTGTPNPNNIRPVNGWSGLEIYQNNTNLLDGNQLTIPITFSNTVYGGYIDLITGEVVKTYHKLVLDGSIAPEYQGKESGSSRFRVHVNKFNFPLKQSSHFEIYCDTLEKCITENRPNWSIWGPASTKKYFCIYTPTTYTTAASLVTYLQSHPIEIIYKLDTSEYVIVDQLSPQQLKTLLDQNYIWSNTNDTTEVSYSIHDSNMIQIAKKHIISAAEPHIETSSTGIFTTDRVGKLAQCKINFNFVPTGTGDPSPTNVWSISGLTGLNIYHSGADTTNFTTIPIDWTNVAGTLYGGYIDCISGQLVRTYTRQNLGAVTWNPSSNHSYTTRAIALGGIYVDNATLPNCFCDKMTVKTLNDMRANYLSQTSDEYWIAFTSSLTIIASPAFNNMTDEEVNTFMESVTLYMKFPPSMYIYYQLTPQQLNALRGANNIWSDANGPIEVKYWTH